MHAIHDFYEHYFNILTTFVNAYIINNASNTLFYLVLPASIQETSTSKNYFGFMPG